VGLFLEIEIMDYPDNIKHGIREIDALVDSLEIGDYTVENKPYRDLVMEKKGE
jgi:adenylate cyclase class IV